jgi:hypothetical protein
MKGQEDEKLSFLRRIYLEIICLILFVGSIFLYFFTIENYFYLTLAIGATLLVLVIFYTATKSRSKKKSMEVGRLNKEVRDPSHEFLSEISTIRREKKAPGSPTAVTNPSSRSGGGTTGGSSWGLHHIDVWVPISSEVKATKVYEKFLSLIKKTEEPSIISTLDILNNEIKKSEGKYLEYYLDDSGLNISFKFKKGSKYSFIIGAIVQIINKDTITFDGILSTRQDFTFSLKAIQDNNEVEFIHTSNFSLKWEDLSSKESISSKLKTLDMSLNQLIIDRKAISGILLDPQKLSIFLELLLETYNELVVLQSKVSFVSKIQCYQCGELLDQISEKCANCDSIRPECSVCRLELYPSEKDKVVQTPCCGVYAHKNHMIMWLHENEKCPNCKKKQITWLNQLLESS